MSEKQFPSEWLRGMTSLAVLAVLAQQPAHGYAVAAALEDAGLGHIKGGTLYPILTRLEKAGLLHADWQIGDHGPGKKVFSLTEQGQQELHTLRQQWQVFATVLGGIVEQ